MPGNAEEAAEKWMEAANGMEAKREVSPTYGAWQTCGRDKPPKHESLNPEMEGRRTA